MGLRLSGGTIANATIIAALYSTKSADKARDLGMRQTRQPVVLRYEGAYRGGQHRRRDRCPNQSSLRDLPTKPWSSDHYDMVLVFVQVKHGQYTKFTQVPQMLLAGGGLFK